MPPTTKGRNRATVEFCPRTERPCSLCHGQTRWQVWARYSWRRPICLSCIWDIYAAEDARREAIVGVGRR